jgi:hypothetical protein
MRFIYSRSHKDKAWERCWYADSCVSLGRGFASMAVWVLALNPFRKFYETLGAKLSPNSGSNAAVKLSEKLRTAGAIYGLSCKVLEPFELCSGRLINSQLFTKGVRATTLASIAASRARCQNRGSLDDCVEKGLSAEGQCTAGLVCSAAY